MRFRFCGGMDCPDWVLAEMALLSRLTSIKVRLLSQQIGTKLTAGDWNEQKISQLVADAKFTEVDLKGCLSVLNFILETAGKHNCEPEDLHAELQQLGLPAEHAQSLTKAYSAIRDRLVALGRQRTLRLPPLSIDDDWSITCMTSPSSSLIGPNFEQGRSGDGDSQSAATANDHVTKTYPVAVVTVKIGGDSTIKGDAGTSRKEVWSFSEMRTRMLLHELKEARDEMDLLGKPGETRDIVE